MDQNKKQNTTWTIEVTHLSGMYDSEGRVEINIIKHYFSFYLYKRIVDR